MLQHYSKTEAARVAYQASSLNQVKAVLQLIKKVLLEVACWALDILSTFVLIPDDCGC